MKHTNYSNTKTDVSVRLSSEQHQFQIISYGYDSCPTDRTPSFFDKDIYSLHFIIAGSGYLQYEGGPLIDLHAGQIFILLPHHKITYYPNKNNAWSYFWIDFMGSHSSSLFKDLNISRETPTITLENKNEIKKLFIENFAYAQQFPDFADIINQSYLCKILFLCLKHSEVQKQHNNPSFYSHINKAQKYIEENYSDFALSLEQVAKVCDLNKAYLSRIFVKSLGLTFTNYLTNLRMRKATTLFNAGETSVKKVAYAVGFLSPYYFSNVFKRTIKISPSTYIAQVKQKNTTSTHKNTD